MEAEGHAKQLGLPFPLEGSCFGKRAFSKTILFHFFAKKRMPEFKTWGNPNVQSAC